MTEDAVKATKAVRLPKGVKKGTIGCSAWLVEQSKDEYRNVLLECMKDFDNRNPGTIGGDVHEFLKSVLARLDREDYVGVALTWHDMWAEYCILQFEKKVSEKLGKVLPTVEV